MNRGHAVAVASGGLFSCAALFSVPAPALACYGIPCAPSMCVTAGVGANHTTPMPVPTALPTLTTRGAGGGGLGTLPFASKNMTLLSQMPLTSIGGGVGSSLYGWTDPVTKREYAIMGRSNGTAIIDITTPTNPKYVAEIPKVVGSSNTTWREPKVYQNTVYIGVDGTTHGLQVFDLTKVRTYRGTTMTFNADSVYTGVTRVHTLAVNPNSGHLYLAGTNVNGGGLRVLNVNNPANPVAVGNTTLDGYTHETQVVTYDGPDAQYAGREIAFNSNGNNGLFSILDVTNKANITRISSRTYLGERYIHQGWLTEDKKYFFQNDELDEPSPAARTRTHLWNVSDLDNPVYRGFFEHSTTSIDHNLYVKDGFVFETNYTTGIRMLRIGNLESSNPNDWLKEEAYFDTYQANDGASFNGAWNNYPFFKSGVVAVSDINGGLFLVAPNVRGWKLGYGGGPVQPPDRFGPGGGPESVPEPTAASAALLAGAVTLLRRRRA